MWKKFMSAIAFLAVIASLMPVTALAADVPASLISSVTLSVAGSTPDRFEPSASQVLGTAVVFATSGASNTSGYAKVKQGSTDIRLLTAWTSTATPSVIPTWDGRAVDASGQAVCGSAGAVCPDGDYTVEVYVTAPFGSDALVDTKTAAFSIFTTPAIAISGLSVSPDSFNPLTQTADISFNLSATGFVTVEILDGATTVVKTLVPNQSLASGSHSKADVSALAWNGSNDAGTTVANKTYSARVRSRATVDGTVVDTKTANVTVNAPSTLSISSFTITTESGGDSIFDPSLLGANENLSIQYAVNVAPTQVNIKITNPDGAIVVDRPSSEISTTFVWNGEYNNRLVIPGTYQTKLIVSKTGETNVEQTKTFTVAYANTNKGEVTNFTVTPESFDPDLGDTTIRFNNTKESAVTVEVLNADGGALKTFDSYNNQSYSANYSHDFTWNGRNTSGGILSAGAYKLVVTTRNDYGVVRAEKVITILDTGATIPTSNAHIASVSLSPSTTFEPAEDDELEIEFNIEQDLDSLEIFAVKGAEEISLYEETDLEEENDVVTVWNGTDADDEYAMDGSWRIRFESVSGTTSLVAEKLINVKYVKPEIRDLRLSKNKFDNEENEFTSILFRVDEDANVNIQILESGSLEEDFVEDMEVEADQWYAVEWDGDGFDYDNDVDIKLIAENIVNEKIFDSDTIAVDLAEDTVSGDRANVLNDFIGPVATTGAEEMSLNYFIDEVADVEVTIHKGESASGSVVIKLLDLTDQESGAYEVIWSGKDSNNRKLSDGLYSYKIVASRGGTETEKGIFVVGDVGEVEGTAGGTSGGGTGTTTGSAGTSGNVGTGVVVDGMTFGGDTTPTTGGDTGGVTPPTNCAGFTDLSPTFSDCDAIEFVKERGIFAGNPDGTFRPYVSINRAEILKVIMEAFDVYPPDAIIGIIGNLGFTDVLIGEWYMTYIKGAKDLGIFSGDAGKSTARPDAPVNRVEALKLLFETLRVSSGYQATDCSFAYGDTPSGAWYHKYVCEAKSFGLFDTSGGSFNPDQPATRLEMARLFYRLNLAGII